MNEENEKELMMEDEKVSLGQKIKWYIVKPSRFFEEFKMNTKVLIHFIIITVLTAIATLITSSKPIEITESMTSLQVDIARTANEAPAISAGTIAGLIIGPIILYLLFALVRFAFAKIFNGEGKFKEMLGLVLVTSYPVALGGILTSIITDPSIDVSVMDAILSKVNIWSIWQLVLLIIGMKVMFKLSMKKSLIINIAIFLVTTAFTLGGAVLNNNIANMAL